MKKFYVLLMICMCCLFTSVYASNLEFTPVGGGKFIYCNNPEAIEDDMLLNGDNPRWIMNNKDLTPDMYYLYFSHFNYTGGGSLGYPIELDMVMTAKENSKITVHKAFFTSPYNYANYENWNKKVYESDWGMLDVCAKMLGIPMCDIRGNDFYIPYEYEPVTIEVEKGDRVWLSDYMRTNYQPTVYGKGMHIQALVEIESGVMDFDLGAIKRIGAFNERPDPETVIADGEYRWDYTLKGVADTLPEVEADVEYTINDETKDGEKIPVFLKNSYIPQGHTVTGWYTQLNPQNDIWSKTTAAESDILTLKYKDDQKLKYYGSNIPESEKDNVWVFDTKHSALRKSEPRFNLGSEKDFVPNFLLDTNTDNHTYACNIGNFGVTTTYNMSVTNETEETKFCTLVLTAASEVIAYATNSKGEKSYAYVKDFTGEKVTDNMLSYEIPPKSTEKFKFSIILPVNYNSGILNELVISDNNIQEVEYEEKLRKAEEEKLKNNIVSTSVFYGEGVDSIFPRFPDATDEKVWRCRNGFEYLRGRNNGIIRWMAYDGAPEWYLNHWCNVSTVYMTDKDYNITAEYTFPSLPCGASYKEDYFYIKTARDGVFKSKDGAKWEKTEEALPEYVPYYDLDYASPWAIPELEKSWDLNIRLKNIAGESYNLKMPILREAFCDLAVQLLDKYNVGTEDDKTFEFSDTQNPNVLRLAGLGIIDGFGDGTFRPGDDITREQAAVILYRTAKCLNYEIKNRDIDDTQYSDFAEVSDWAQDAVEFVTEMGVMQGVGDGRFEPFGFYSREQSAATMVRMYEYKK